MRTSESRRQNGQRPGKQPSAPLIEKGVREGPYSAILDVAGREGRADSSEQTIGSTLIQLQPSAFTLAGALGGCGCWRGLDQTRSLADAGPLLPHGCRSLITGRRMPLRNLRGIIISSSAEGAA